MTTKTAKKDTYEVIRSTTDNGYSYTVSKPGSVGSVRMGFTMGGFPNCCALETISYFTFNGYSQNSGDLWAEQGRKFFEIIGDDFTPLKKALDYNYITHDMKATGGVVITFSEKVSEKDVVEKILDLFNKIGNFKFEPVFEVKSNHANYPVVCYLATNKKYNRPKGKAVEAVKD